MTNTFGGLPLYDSWVEILNRKRLRRTMDVTELDKANSLFVPSGPGPARGWIVLVRSDYNTLTLTNPYNLTISDSQQNTITFQNLYIVNARCITRGLASDPKAVYLVEITDKTGLLNNQYFTQSINVAYNIRSPAYPEQYYSGTLNGVSPWTWDGMVQDIWSKLSLGTYPHLPVSVYTTINPEGWSFTGTSGFDALNKILEHLGCVLTRDLTKPAATQLGIVHLGDTDATQTALFTTYAGQLEDDEDWLDTGQVRLPGTIQVIMHRRNQYYGTEETVRKDAFQWSTTPTYTLPIATGVTGATGFDTLWTDFSPRFDENNAIIDAATASLVATNRAADRLAILSRGNNGYLRQRYIGTLPFVTGVLIDGVSWQHIPLADKKGKLTRRGWITEVIRTPMAPWPEVTEKGAWKTGTNPDEDSTNTQPPEMRPGFPNYPVHTQVIYSTGGSAGPFPGYGGLFYTGFAAQFQFSSGLRSREDCIIWQPNSISLPPGYYVGRLVGSLRVLPSGPAPVPLYVTDATPAPLAVPSVYGSIYAPNNAVVVQGFAQQITFSSVVLDSGGATNIASNVVVAPVNGIYEVNAAYFITASQGYLAGTGTVTAQLTGYPERVLYGCINNIFSMAAGDTLALWVIPNSAGYISYPRLSLVLIP
jgi:hypothetical protein